jgi:hypothetical protein
MNEMDLFEHRINELEENVKILYGKVNGFAVAQAQVNIKLDNLIQSLDEIKDSISKIKSRPSVFWDKLVFAFIGALGAGIGTAFLTLFKGV